MIANKSILNATAIIAIIIISMGIHAKASVTSPSSRVQRIDGNQPETNQKPTIDSISDLTYHLEENFFSLEFTVYFQGTDYLNICLEEEFNSMLRNSYYNGPGKVHVKTGKLIRMEYSWIHITAKNDYGSAERILEFPPFFKNPAEGGGTLEIECVDMAESGTMSAYTTPGFCIKTDIPALSSLGWTLTLPLKDSGYDDIIPVKRYADRVLSCLISPFEDPSAYDISEDGLLKGQLIFSGLLPDGSNVSSTREITFDFKPFIESAVIERIEDEAPYPSYNAYYKVKYFGADKIEVSVEEEFGTDARVSYVYEPYIAYGCATHIKAPYKAWIDFVAENQYGKDTYTIELLPYGEVANSVDNILDDSSTSDPEHTPIEVYDINGRKIADIYDISEAYSLPVKGLLILKIGATTKKIMTR